MKPYFEGNGVVIYHGDCREVMRELEPVHAIVTDPPYGLEFMGKEWDSFGRERDYKERTGYQNKGILPGYGRGGTSEQREQYKRKSNNGFQEFSYLWALEALRVLLPGGHLLSFGGSRTYHRMACAIEDAGFEIRDQISYFYSSDVDRNAFLDSLSLEQQESFLKAFGRSSSVDWCYGSGFPKSLSVAKAIKPKLESRYGKSTCNCLDDGDGHAARQGSGRSGREEIWIQRTTSGGSSEEVGDSILSINASGTPSPMRNLREASAATTERFEEIKAPVLLQNLRECCPKESRLGHASLWSGMEECSGGDSRTGQSVSDVREDASGKWSGTSCTSSEAIPLRGDESSEKSSSSVRFVPSQDRECNRASSILDPNRREPRRVISDDHCGWSSAVAHVCSWCGLPSKEWLSEISSLGTALKPAHEPVCVARKPLVGTVAANVLQFGTGAMNIDACRIDGPVESDRLSAIGTGQGRELANAAGPAFGAHLGGVKAPPHDLGRWPANVIHDGSEEVVNLFPQGQSGSIEPHHIRRTSKTVNVYGDRNAPDEEQTYGDSGSAARFFYTAKADKEERERNMDSALAPLAYGNQAQAEVKRGNMEHGGKSGINTVKMRGNTHPTVKPLDLMAYLCKLLSPPHDGILLDPFMGSGSTIIAGRRFYRTCIGIELEEKYWRNCCEALKPAGTCFRRGKHTRLLACNFLAFHAIIASMENSTPIRVGSRVYLRNAIAGEPGVVHEITARGFAKVEWVDLPEIGRLTTHSIDSLIVDEAFCAEQLGIVFNEQAA